MENTLLNLIPSSYIPEVHLSQYDVGRELPFKLMDGNTEYSVPSGATVTVKATKPSGLGFVVSGTFSDNIVTIVNTETMTNESGRFSAELSISSGATLLGTSNFIFNIERSPHPEGTTDGDAETLIPELTLLVNEIRESNAKVESMTASASPLPSGSNPTAEYDPDTNNLAFGIPTSEVTTEDLYKAFITKSASGSIASFSDGGDDLPMKSLLVNIVPKQSGSGEPSPSNVRPISGYSEVVTSRVGKNLLKNTASTMTHKGITYTVNADGTITANGTATDRSYCVIDFDYDYFYNHYKDGTYILSGCPSGGSMSTYALDLQAFGSGNLYDLGEGVTINTSQLTNQQYRFVIDIKVGTTMNNAVFKPMLRLANTSAEYEPYNGTTYTTSLGQTVYGGTLDVVSGKLTITHKYWTENGSGSWQYTSSGGARFYIGGVSADAKNVSTNGWSNYGKMADTFTDNGIVVGSNGRINLCGTVASAFADVNALKTALASTPLQVAYELATPTEIQLTPTEVKTLLGSNNIWSESGTVEVEYRADSTLAYEELANAIISLGGNI